MNFYEIRVKGHISPKRMQRFEGFTATLLPTGETVLLGQVADQVALHGILRSICDLGLTLLLVQNREAGVSDQLSVAQPDSFHLAQDEMRVSPKLNYETDN